MDKRVIRIGIASFTVLLVACVPLSQQSGSTSSEGTASSSEALTGETGAETSSLRASEDTGGNGGTPAMMQASSQASSKSAVESKASDSVRVIEVSADNFVFTPSVIRVKKGENVRLTVKGVGGFHGLSVPALSINLTIPAGESVSAELDTSVVGTFDFFCSVPCGPGHQTMRGSIVIEE